MEPFSKEMTQGPNQIPSAVVLWLFPTGTYARIGTKLCRVWKRYEKYKKRLLFDIIEGIINKFKKFEYNLIQKFTSNTDLRKKDFLNEENLKLSASAAV